jgi:hypothetical protein
LTAVCEKSAETNSWLIKTTDTVIYIEQTVGCPLIDNLIEVEKLERVLRTGLFLLFDALFINIAYLGALALRFDAVIPREYTVHYPVFAVVVPGNVVLSRVTSCPGRSLCAISSQTLTM